MLCSHYLVTVVETLHKIDRQKYPIFVVNVHLDYCIKHVIDIIVPDPN